MKKLHVFASVISIVITLIFTSIALFVIHQILYLYGKEFYLNKYPILSFIVGALVGNYLYNLLFDIFKDE